MGRNEKGLILLGQMRPEEVGKGLSQIFQSCTFNRSVTSPIELVAIVHFDEQMEATTESADILQKVDERANYLCAIP